MGDARGPGGPTRVDAPADAAPTPAAPEAPDQAAAAVVVDGAAGQVVDGSTPTTPTLAGALTASGVAATANPGAGTTAAVVAPEGAAVAVGATTGPAPAGVGTTPAPGAEAAVVVSSDSADDAHQLADDQAGPGTSSTDLGSWSPLVASSSSAELHRGLAADATNGRERAALTAIDDGDRHGVDVAPAATAGERARLVVGDVDDRVVVSVAVRHGTVDVSIRADDRRLDDALTAGRAELDAALGRHGLMTSDGGGSASRDQRPAAWLTRASLRPSAPDLDPEPTARALHDPHLRARA